MTTKLLTLLFLISSFYGVSQNSNYVLIIDGDSIAIDLNKSISHKIKGKTINLKVIQSAEQFYSDDFVTFKYPKDLSVSKTDLGGGIEQLMVMKATGSGFMIQSYRSFDPSGLISMMLSELTKESVAYGYEQKISDFSHTLENGQEIKGKTASLSYKGDEEIYTVAAYGGKDEGLLVLTLLFKEQNEPSEDEQFLEKFLNSLTIKLKND